MGLTHVQVPHKRHGSNCPHDRAAGGSPNRVSCVGSGPVVFWVIYYLRFFF